MDVVSHKGNSGCFWLIGMNSCEAVSKKLVHILKQFILATSFPGGRTSLCQASIHCSLSECHFYKFTKTCDIQLSCSPPCKM